jgi:hypothetical protein
MFVMTVLSADSLGLPAPTCGWPAWVTEAPYVGAAHPLAEQLPRLIEGANCQRYAYSVLALFNRWVPEVRSSELWSAPLIHPGFTDAESLDLALFNHSSAAWGAHVALITPAGLIHLCAEEGRPALWGWSEFSSRRRYARLVGVVRPTRSEPIDARPAR